MNWLSPHFPRLDYPHYFLGLWRKTSIRALVTQFRYQTRRPFSRKLIQRFAPQGYGIEIGVGETTIAPRTRTILTDGFFRHAQGTSIASHLCKANAIGCPDATFEFVLSEHVLEHLANPVAALKEWIRALKPSGKLFLFLPRCDLTFDRYRKRTSLQHLLDDDRNQVPENDPTHLDEWKTEVLARNLAPHYAKIPVETHLALGLVHHHVWMPQDMVELLEYLGLQIVFQSDLCPDRLDSFVVIAQRNPERSVPAIPRDPPTP